MISISESQTTLAEGFETWPPSGWEIYNLGVAFDGWWQDWEGIYHSGTHSASSGIDNSQCDNWLVTSQVNIASDNYELRFWEYNDDVIYYDKASVWISTGSFNPADGDFVELIESTQIEGVWQEHVIDLSAYNGQNIAIAFRYEGTWHKWYIDDVKISPSTYFDGALTQITNPTDVSGIASNEDVIVTFKNTGNLVINDADIEWFINNVSQGTYNGTALNLQPNESIDINLGTYSFLFDNSYTIKAYLTLPQASDFDPSNDIINGTYEVSLPRDGLLVGVTPEGMSPNTGTQKVSVIISNVGNNTINLARVDWTVDDIEQLAFLSNSLGLQPGQSTEIVIGYSDFSTGLHEISATLDIFGDINDTNDTYLSYAAIDIFWESFEGRIFPPENWTIEQGVLDNINFDYPVHGEKYYASVPEWNLFYNVPDTLYTPLLDISAGDKFNFYLKGSTFSPDNTSLIWKDGVTGEVHHIQDISSPTLLWEPHVIDISAAVGVNYIGILNEAPGQGSNSLSKFDLFTSDAKLHVSNNDLGITNGDIYFLAKQNLPESYNCKIRNLGNAQVNGSEYTLKLMESPGVELASVQGVTLIPWEEKTITINHTFNTIDQHRLYFEIDYTSDENLKNNTFRETTVSVVPNTIEFNSIGDEDGSYSGLPFNASPNVQTLGEDDMSQALYYADEFNIVGEIYGIIYNYDNLIVNETVQHLPLKVWVGQTNSIDFTGGWEPDNELVLVFDGVVEVLPGFEKQMYIPFNIPVQYTGLDNIVIQHYQYDPEYPTSLLRFTNNHLSSGPMRSIQASDIYELDINNPPASNGYYITQNLTYSTFVIDPVSDKGDSAGTVFNSANTTLSNANVSIGGTGISDTSDSNGNYSIQNLPYGDYDVTASLFGYYDETQTITLNASSITQDFHLEERAQVEVIGHVVGSNNESIPIEYVDVTINGYIVDNTTTNYNGDFTFSNVYGDITDYNVTLSIYGYYEKTVQATVSDATLDLGVIVLDQEFLSPFDVEVENNTETQVTWSNPYKGGKDKMQYDLGVDSNGYANEPNEEVWLGNIFPITEITTLSSVEIGTFYIQSVSDYVTIDVIDVATNEILASSESFLLLHNSVQAIDIPNIVVYNDVAVMVHWQNNPNTTNFLIIDYSLSTIQNTAAIRYPSQSIQLLSDFFGNGQSQSFHVRVNILDDGSSITSEEQLTYNIYRGLASEFPNISNWDLLNTSPITNLSHLDMDTAGIDINEDYRYAVETIYSDGLSEVTFSNIISGNLLDVDDNDYITSQIKVYPVPASDKVTIYISPQLGLESSILIHDVLGRQQGEIELSKIKNGTAILDVTNYAAGMYFIEFNVENKVAYKKLIIKH